MNCSYCQQPAELVTGERIYPHLSELHNGQYYLCAPCNAYVGCHKGTTKALGRLANSQLRIEKMRAHEAFDGYWKPLGIRRGAAYAWLAEQLGIDERQCHIGMFDVEQCRRVVIVCREVLA